MDITNKERTIFNEIQKKLFYMIPEKWEAIYLYASIVEESFKKPVGEMYFYYLPKGILKRKPVNVYQIPTMFNIEEESYNEIIQELYLDIKSLRELHREIKKELWTNITISIQNFQFKIEYAFEDVGKNSEFTPYERHIIWRYKNIDSDINHLTNEEKDIVKRYFDSDLILFEKENNQIYTENSYKLPVHNIIDYEKTLTIEAALASSEHDENKEKVKKKPSSKEEKKEKKENRKNKELKSKEVLEPKKVMIDNSNQILFSRVEKMKMIENQRAHKNDIDDDIILTSDFMTKKE